MKNNDFMIEGVEVPGTRERLIVELLDLMDKKYQEDNWIYETKPGGEESFHAEIFFSYDMVIEEMFMDTYIDEDRLPLDKIGTVLKNEEEASILLEVSRILDDIFHSCASNKDFIESLLLPKLRISSLEAFRVFMESEKENVEFCDFILGIIKKERDSKAVEGFENSYAAILAYTNKCKAYLE